MFFLFILFPFTKENSHHKYGRRAPKYQPHGAKRDGFQISQDTTEKEFPENPQLEPQQRHPWEQQQFIKQGPPVFSDDSRNPNPNPFNNDFPQKQKSRFEDYLEKRNEKQQFGNIDKKFDDPFSQRQSTDRITPKQSQPKIEDFDDSWFLDDDIDKPKEEPKKRFEKPKENPKEFKDKDLHDDDLFDDFPVKTKTQKNKPVPLPTPVAEKKPKEQEPLEDLFDDFEAHKPDDKQKDETKELSNADSNIPKIKFVSEDKFTISKRRYANVSFSSQKKPVDVYCRIDDQIKKGTITNPKNILCPLPTSLFFDKVFLSVSFDLKTWSPAEAVKTYPSGLALIIPSALLIFLLIYFKIVSHFRPRHKPRGFSPEQFLPLSARNLTDNQFGVDTIDSEHTSLIHGRTEKEKPKTFESMNPMPDVLLEKSPLNGQ